LRNTSTIDALSKLVADDAATPQLSFRQTRTNHNSFDPLQLKMVKKQSPQIGVDITYRQ
jgi:hypothetical protein